MAENIDIILPQQQLARQHRRNRRQARKLAALPVNAHRHARHRALHTLRLSNNAVTLYNAIILANDMTASSSLQPSNACLAMRGDTVCRDGSLRAALLLRCGARNAAGDSAHWRVGALGIQACCAYAEYPSCRSGRIFRPPPTLNVRRHKAFNNSTSGLKHSTWRAYNCCHSGYLLFPLNIHSSSDTTPRKRRTRTAPLLRARAPHLHAHAPGYRAAPRDALTCAPRFYPAPSPPTPPCPPPPHSET